MRLELERERANLLTCTMPRTAVHGTAADPTPPTRSPPPCRARDFHLPRPCRLPPRRIAIGVSVVGSRTVGLAIRLGLARDMLS